MKIPKHPKPIYGSVLHLLLLCVKAQTVGIYPQILTPQPVVWWREAGQTFPKQSLSRPMPMLGYLGECLSCKQVVTIYNQSNFLLPLSITIYFAGELSVSSWVLVFKSVVFVGNGGSWTCDLNLTQ